MSAVFSRDRIRVARLTSVHIKNWCAEVLFPHILKWKVPPLFTILQNYWGNNSDLLAFDIDRTLKIDGQLKAAVIYRTVFWLPGKLTSLDWIKRISVNLPRRLILETSRPWSSLVTAGWGGRQHLRMEKHEVPNGAQKVKPIFVADKSWAKMNWMVRRVVNTKLASLVRLQKSWRITRKLFNSSRPGLLYSSKKMS